MTFPRVESDRLMLLLSRNAVPESFEMPGRKIHVRVLPYMTSAVGGGRWSQKADERNKIS